MSAADPGVGDPGTNLSGWRAGLGELGHSPAFAPYKDEDLVQAPRAVLKSYVEQQPLIGGDKIPKPQDSWSSEQYAKFWGELGRPATPKEYQVSDVTPLLPKNDKGEPLFGIDEKFRDHIFEKAHEAGLTSKQIDLIYKGYVERQVAEYQAFQEKDRKDRDTWVAEQRARLGTTFDATLDLANRALSAADAGPGSDLLAKLEGLEFSDGTPLLRHPAFLDVFGALGKKLSEGNLLPGEKQAQYGRTAEHLDREIAEFTIKHGAAMVGEGPQAQALQQQYNALSTERARLKGVTPT